MAKPKRTTSTSTSTSTTTAKKDSAGAAAARLAHDLCDLCEHFGIVAPSQARAAVERLGALLGPEGIHALKQGDALGVVETLARRRDSGS